MACAMHLYLLRSMNTAIGRGDQPRVSDISPLNYSVVYCRYDNAIKPMGR